MARKSIFKRVGAGAISGTIALLSCNNTLRSHDEPESIPRFHPIASRQKAKAFGSRATLLPKRSARGSQQPKLLRITAAKSIFDSLKSRSPASLETTESTSGSVGDNSGDSTTEEANEVLIEGKPISVPENILNHSNAITFPRIDTVVSGFADSFSSELLNTIILGADNVGAVPDAYEHVEICSPPVAVGTVPTVPSVTTTALISVRRIAAQVSTIARSTSFIITPLATTINPDLLFALLAERSIILPSLPELGVAWTESSLVSFVAPSNNLTILTPARSFAYSPRPPITYEAAIPTPFAGEETNVLQSGFIVEEVEGTDLTTSDHGSPLPFEESPSPVLVDSATQTDNVEYELVPQGVSTQDLPVETESQHCSSSEQSLLESECSDTPATSRSGRSESPPEFTREEEAAHYQEHIEHLESVIRCLRGEAEDHEAEKETLNNTVNHLQREKEEVESDAENLRSQLTRREEFNGAEKIEVDEPLPRRTLQAIEDHYQTSAMLGLGRMMRLEETLHRMKDTIMAQEEALRIHENDDTGNIVMNILNSLQAAQHQNRWLLAQNREGEEAIRNLTLETQQSRQMMPLIEQQVRELIQERNDLARQLGQYRHPHHQTQSQGRNQ